MATKQEIKDKIELRQLKERNRLKKMRLRHRFPDFDTTLLDNMKIDYDKYFKIKSTQSVSDLFMDNSLLSNKPIVPNTNDYDIDSKTRADNIALKISENYNINPRSFKTLVDYFGIGYDKILIQQLKALIRIKPFAPFELNRLYSQMKKLKCSEFNFVMEALALITSYVNLVKCTTKKQHEESK